MAVLLILNQGSTNQNPGKFILKSIWKFQEPRIAKTILKKEEQV